MGDERLAKISWEALMVFFQSNFMGEKGFLYEFVSDDLACGCRIPVSSITTADF